MGHQGARAVHKLGHSHPPSNRPTAMVDVFHSQVRGRKTPPKVAFCTGRGALTTGVGLAELRFFWEMWASNKSAKKAANGTHIAIRMSETYSSMGIQMQRRMQRATDSGFSKQALAKNGLYEKHAPACGLNTPATPSPATPATGAATSTTTKCHLSQRRGHPIQPQTAVLTDSHSGQAAVNTYTADKHHRGLRSAKEKRTRRGQSGLSLFVDVET